MPAPPPAAGDPAPPDVASGVAAVIAFQVTVRIPGADGRIREVGAENAVVHILDPELGLIRGRDTARAPGGIAEPYPTSIGHVYDVWAVFPGYRFPTERITVNLEETFVPIVGEIDEDVHCHLAGKIIDESGRYVWRFLRVSLYDAEGHYLQGRETPLNQEAKYDMQGLRPGHYILRVTSGRADVAFASEPTERRAYCFLNEGVHEDFVVR
jgi:hypothetical protein